MQRLQKALGFADDIPKKANIPYMQQMLHKLSNDSEKYGLKMNKSKKRVTMESDTPIYVNNT